MAIWKFDPAHMKVGFTARHMMVSKVHGEFEKVSGQIEFDPEHPEQSSVVAVVDLDSVATGMPDRDNHLRSADFFDVENHPEMKFVSTDAKLSGEGEGTLTGDLTIRGVTRPVTLDVEYFGPTQDPYGRDIFGFTASAKINREDWGLTWNVGLEAGGWLVGKEIKIEIDGEAIKETEAEAEAVG